MDIKIDLPRDVKFILKELNKYGLGLLVGGSIRDILLGVEPNDFDFATNIKYNELLEIFKNFSPKEIGKDFGIIQIKINGIHYEIAKFRQDGQYSDNRRPDSVKFVNSFYEDASRRDFSVNAMGYDGNVLYDFFNGQADLKEGIIRFVGNGETRIKEDSLRMLRAIRFLTKSKDFKLHNYTYEDVYYNSPLIKNISPERIRMELDKILVSNLPSKGFKILQDTGLLKHIIPELDICKEFNQNNSHHDKDLFEHTMVVLDNTEPNLVTRLSALFHDIGKPDTHSKDDNGESHYYLHHKVSADMSEDIMKRLKYDNDTINKVKRLIYNHMNKSDRQSDKSIKKFINRVGKENLDMMFDLLKSDIIGHKPPHNFESLNELKSKCNNFLSEKEPTTRFELEIKGKDIIKLGFKQGKIIGEILENCMDLVLDNPKLNNKEDLIRFVKNKYKL